MTGQEIHDICKKYNIQKYSINSDGSIDASYVDLKNNGLSKLPIKFNKVYGYFNCSNNDLTTLEGSPKIINRRPFYINDVCLVYDKLFDCSNNKLISLEGFPEKVDIGKFNYFNSLNNPLESLYGYNLPYDKLQCDNKIKLIRKNIIKILDIL